ncbi:hypothetical protein TDB9533_03827 [Thalassocella blandensis]|nr:hypothetical protein TDB9533_03827 [Thalassocella blandensis]
MRLGIILAIAGLAITACSQKNSYLEDPQLAKSTLEKCHTDLAAAHKVNDYDRIESLSENQECKAAAEAHAMHVREGKIDPVRRKSDRPITQEDLDRQKQMADKSTIVTPSETKAPDPMRRGSTDPEYYMGLPFDEYYLWSKRCISSVVDRRSKECEVVRSLTDQRYEVEIDKLRKRFANKPEALERYSQSVCIGEDMVDYLCEFTLKLLKEHKSNAEK